MDHKIVVLIKTTDYLLLANPTTSCHCTHSAAVNADRLQLMMCNQSHSVVDWRLSETIESGLCILVEETMETIFFEEN